MVVNTCKYCGAVLTKDCIALNKKLISTELNSFACLNCLADDFDCTVDDLNIKIEEFKEAGCTLFR